MTELSPAERARLDAIEAAEPAPESCHIRQNALNRIEPDPFAPGTAVWVYEVPGGYLVTPAAAPQDEPNIGDTCCGRCPGSSCYVDQVAGA